MIEFLEHQVIGDPNDTWTSLLPQSSKFWKRRYDILAKDKADMEAAYEREIKRLRATYLPASRASRDPYDVYFTFLFHLSSFSYIDAEDEVGTPFQALSMAEPIEKRSPSFASYRDAKLAIECGAVAGLGKMIELEDNKSRAGIDYSSGVFNDKGLFKSGGFIHADQTDEAAAILEEDAEDSGNFVIPGGISHNWVVVDVPTVIHRSK
ncbi:hypothetical protein KIW84_050144 [Lathyrus oleraceus]|uniref:Uncharacterized protein n=1 Tax=Pisum sativum TaxID=3888 RepID=A0A9D4WKE7_PEA|nr:hypothetical protein KIW84_050144 [Pisum sativum]